MSQYDKYSEIENHVNISRKLFHLEKKCEYLLAEFTMKKKIDRKKQYTKPVSDIINILHALGRNRPCERSPYSSMIYYLDEWLFSRANDDDVFIIEDTKYPLSSVYFNRGDWIGHMKPFIYEVEESIDFTVKDAIALHSFFHEYSQTIECILFNIQENTSKTDCERKLTNKIIKHINRIINRYLKGMRMMIDIINQDFDKKIETYLNKKIPPST